MDDLIIDTLSNRGIEPLVDFLARDTIHPTLQPLWTDTGMTFTDIVEYFANLGGIGFGILVNFVVGPDELQSDKNIIVVSRFILSCFCYQVK